MDFQGQLQYLPAQLPLLDGVRTGFADFLRGLSAPEAEVSRWELVLAEAATNAILHGSKKNPDQRIEIAWSCTEDRVRLEVGDSGSGPGKPAQALAELPADPLQTSGRGLFLIHEFCDDVQYWRGPAGFRLVMSKKLPSPSTPARTSPDGLLQAALLEITQCYESLAAFYRLGDALITAERLPEFFQKAIGDIARVVPHHRLRLVFSPALQPELRAALKPPLFAFADDTAGATVDRVLNSGHEFIWQDSDEISHDQSWREFACGAVMPLRAGGATLGALILARSAQPYLVAAELSTVRTYADVFGIALANADHALVREREQSALRELKIAAETQADLLPLPAITTGPGWQAVVRRQCALSVAGDYVDICPAPDGGWLLAMVDVMGKGMAAALFAGMVRTALHIHADTGQPLPQLIRNLNRVLCSQTGELTMFATCALVRISPSLDLATVVNAGHCPVYWLGSRKTQPVRQFTASAPPLGLFVDTEFTVEEQALAPGDHLVMFTDGLYEFGAPGTHAGNLEQLAKIITRHGREGGENLWDKFHQQMPPGTDKHAELADDQTLLAWERRA